MPERLPMQDRYNNVEELMSGFEKGVEAQGDSVLIAQRFLSVEQPRWARLRRKISRKPRGESILWSIPHLVNEGDDAVPTDLPQKSPPNNPEWKYIRLDQYDGASGMRDGETGGSASATRKEFLLMHEGNGALIYLFMQHDPNAQVSNPLQPRWTHSGNIIVHTVDEEGAHRLSNTPEAYKEAKRIMESIAPIPDITERTE
jgi:hypothetical protein